MTMRETFGRLSCGDRVGRGQPVNPSIASLKES
jgi:hypothetical protein